MEYCTLLSVVMGCYSDKHYYTLPLLLRIPLKYIKRCHIFTLWWCWSHFIYRSNVRQCLVICSLAEQEIKVRQQSFGLVYVGRNQKLYTTWMELTDWDWLASPWSGTVSFLSIFGLRALSQKENARMVAPVEMHRIIVRGQKCLYHLVCFQW